MNESKSGGWKAVIRWCAAMLSGSLLAGCAVAPTKPAQPVRGDYQYPREYLGWLVRDQMRRHRIVGLSIAVLDDQRVVWSEGFGFADKAAGIPATPATRYRAGSISKVFTAAAVMQLAEAGKIDIDAPLAEALPQFSIRSRIADAAPITPRMIMTHHAGLPGDHAEGMWTDQPAHFTTVVDAMRGNYRAFPPNLVHAYSNVGFTLLGAAIERVSGMPYEEHMRAQLLIPLGMEHSVFETAAPSGPHATRSYDEKGEPAHEPALRDTPAGGLNTSAPELLQFARIWFADGNYGGQPLLSPASIAAMQRPQNAANPLDADLRVGLAWHFAPGAVHGAGPVLMHDGGTINHRAVLMLLPEHKLAVAVLANTANALEPAMEIAGKALASFLEAKTGISQPAKKSPSPSARPYAAAEPEAFPGDYASELGFLTIRERRGRLFVDVGGKTLALKRRDGGYFGLEYRLLGLLPINLGKLSEYELTRATFDGHEVLLAGDAGTFYLAGEKINPLPIPAAWGARLGHYVYVGNDTIIREKLVKSGVDLKIEGGFLLVEIEADGGKTVVALEAIDDATAILRGLGRGRGETVLALRNGADETLRYAGMTFRRELANGKPEGDM